MARFTFTLPTGTTITTRTVSRYALIVTNSAGYQASVIRRSSQFAGLAKAAGTTAQPAWLGDTETGELRPVNKPARGLANCTTCKATIGHLPGCKANAPAACKAAKARAVPAEQDGPEHNAYHDKAASGMEPTPEACPNRMPVPAPDEPWAQCPACKTWLRYDVCGTVVHVPNANVATPRWQPGRASADEVVRPVAYRGAADLYLPITDPSHPAFGSSSYVHVQCPHENGHKDREGAERCGQWWARREARRRNAALV